jgi:hypothetical protein
MSLPARQERILGRMAHSLHASEPHLTSMFAIFTRLARDENWSRSYWRRWHLPSSSASAHAA